MQEKQAKRTECGVIVARFQTHALHEAHRDLIKSVITRHDRVIIFLGLSSLRNTANNPLDFKHRAAMINEDFPDVEVHYIDDNRCDARWSKNLDNQIIKWLPPLFTATLYGSRDSFLKHYQGKFPTCELESEIFISGSQVRKDIIINYPSSKDFRAGVISATGQRYPTSYQTVDVAVVNEDFTEVLLVKKPNENEWRFIGGFSDPRSSSLEEDARREVKEETGIEIYDPIYIGSQLISDWRYRGEVDKIKTALFIAKYLFGKPEGADDVEAAKWFPIDKVLEDDIVEEHHGLFYMFIKKYRNIYTINQTQQNVTH
jgi:bifunctional NMN adenylyltransferase/nudix hydrolase